MFANKMISILAGLMTLASVQTAQATNCSKNIDMKVLQKFIVEKPAHVGLLEATFPLATPALNDFTSGNGAFGAARANGRVNLGVNLEAEACTPVLAMVAGTVVRQAYFFQDSYYVDIKTESGRIVRYGQLSSEKVEGIESGAEVKQGQVIGFVADMPGKTPTLLKVIITKRAKEMSSNKTFSLENVIDPTSILLEAE